MRAKDERRRGKRRRCTGGWYESCVSQEEGWSYMGSGGTRQLTQGPARGNSQAAEVQQRPIAHARSTRCLRTPESEPFDLRIPASSGHLPRSSTSFRRPRSCHRQPREIAATFVLLPDTLPQIGPASDHTDPLDGRQFFVLHKN